MFPNVAKGWRYKSPSLQFLHTNAFSLLMLSLLPPPFFVHLELIFIGTSLSYVVASCIVRQSSTIRPRYYWHTVVCCLRKTASTRLANKTLYSNIRFKLLNTFKNPRLTTPTSSMRYCKRKRKIVKGHLNNLLLWMKVSNNMGGLLLKVLASFTGFTFNHAV